MGKLPLFVSGSPTVVSHTIRWDSGRLSCIVGVADLDLRTALSLPLGFLCLFRYHLASVADFY